jgi:glyoxylase-like metal-dependent hydrolase (beta-lactamase superfamily II)
VLLVDRHLPEERVRHLLVQLRGASAQHVRHPSRRRRARGSAQGLVTLSALQRPPARQAFERERASVLVQHLEAVQDLSSRRRQKRLARFVAKRRHRRVVREQQPAVGGLGGHPVGNATQDGLELVARLAGVESSEMLESQQLLALGLGLLATGPERGCEPGHQGDAPEREEERRSLTGVAPVSCMRVHPIRAYSAPLPRAEPDVRIAPNDARSHPPLERRAMKAPDHDPPGVVRVRAGNPSALTLDGTNSYVVGRWVVDPGPADRTHLDAVRGAATEGIEGVVLTHSHSDHAGGAGELGAPVTLPREGDEVGPFRALATPGHSADSVCLLAGRTCFTGDTVLGTGSVFIAPGEGSLSAYLESLRRLRGFELDVICPGHGPYVWDPRAKLDEYIEHRLDRERRLLAALDSGLRDRDDLLDAAWSDAPAELRPAAELTLAAHLEKLTEEGRLPEGIERPDDLGRIEAGRADEGG